MKKILSLLSSVLLVSSIAPTVASCSDTNSVSYSNVTPKNGWPPVNETFLPIWKEFDEKVQEDVSLSIGEMYDFYSSRYLKLYDKYKDKNVAGKEPVDDFGVPTRETDKIVSEIETCQGMYDYQMNSLRLYYIESTISYIESGYKHRSLSDEDSMNVWAMHYFRSYPFYITAEVRMSNPPYKRSQIIQFNFYDFGGYVPQDSDGNPDYSKGPVNLNPDSPFKPILKLWDGYYDAVDKIYDQVFGKGNSNDRA